ncbi:porin family protein [Mangrovivirga sp. M17]|uniref:Porin family protein n=1 Tax=Mangrovivirga halotolerans TaxID=2993936 RepID=A0ABT3RQF3_9BACT|nr:porin family protein [Mangrovivirga halotolerans]MCX2743604.1 porin family protein [Mangrovivirga halotolerans]
MRIRKIIFASLVLLFSVFMSNAQSSGVGLKGGVNMTKLTTNQPSDYDFGYYGGVFLHLPVNEIFRLQPELIYTKYATTSSYESLGVSYTNDYEMNAIQLPIMGQFYFGEIFYLEAGPQASFLVNQKVTETVDSSVGGGTTTTEEDLSYKETEWYLNFGGGLNLPFGLQVNIRYNLGMNNLNDDSSDDNEIRTRMWQVGLGYKFGSGN